MQNRNTAFIGGYFLNAVERCKKTIAVTIKNKRFVYSDI
jgi:hypothetical protein